MTTSGLRSTLTLGATVLAAVAGAGLYLRGPASAEAVHAVPPPAVDVPVKARTATAVFAGGCFWGVQGVFQHVRGVTSAVSGYAGGAPDTASYPVVSSGTTGHAESVKVTYDPSRISYGKLLQIYFSVVADPTTLDRQGPDEGSQYRSDLFVTTPEQSQVAKSYIAQLEAAHVFGAPIVTKVTAYKSFYPAEGYHQNYLTLHPNDPYIAYNDIPKVEGLRKMFPQDYVSRPILADAN